MTVVETDEWHHLEVGPSLIEDDWEGIPFLLDGFVSPQFILKHGPNCPKAQREEGQDEWEDEYFCQVGHDKSYHSGTWTLEPHIDLKPGLYRVRGKLTQDYWGEYDAEFDIEQLHGPVDEREFEGEHVITE